MTCKLCYSFGLAASAFIHIAIASSYFLIEKEPTVKQQQETPLNLAFFEKKIEPIIKKEIHRKVIIKPTAVVKIPEKKPPKVIKKVNPKPAVKQSPKLAPQIITEKPKPIARFEETQDIEMPLKPIKKEKSKPAKKSFNIIAKIEKKYKIQVVKRIESNKFFPKRARKMRKGGDVLVEFTLNRNGSIQDLKVVQFSGHRSLKKAALKAIKDSAVFPPFPKQLTRESWSFRTNLIYSLQ